jgi:hypothetical protein
MYTFNNQLGDPMQTPKDKRTVEAKRLDELPPTRKTRDPEILAEMRELARRLTEKNH